MSTESIILHTRRINSPGKFRLYVDIHQNISDIKPVLFKIILTNKSGVFSKISLNESVKLLNKFNFFHFACIYLVYEFEKFLNVHTALFSMLIIICIVHPESTEDIYAGFVFQNYPIEIILTIWNLWIDRLILKSGPCTINILYFCLQSY